MNRNTLLTLCAITALGATTAIGMVKATPVAPASATTFTWDGDQNNGDWQDPDNWDVGASYPQSGDIAIITTDGTPPTINGRDEVVGVLRIQSGAVLTITGQKLTLDGTTTHDFRGDLVLSNSTAKVLFSDSVTVSGAGSIKGENDAAEVRIAAGKVLTNAMSTVGIVGQMKIVGEAGPGDNGKFFNGSTGIVQANADGGTILLASGLILDDDSGASWEAVGTAGFSPQPVLQFESGLTFVDSNPELAGDFVLCGDATIDFDVQVRTGGCFDETTANGVLDLAADDYFCDTSTSCGGSAACYDSGTNTFNGNC